MLTLYEFKFSAMGSPCALNLYCNSQQQFDAIALLCVEEVNRLENKYSRYRSDSLVSQINLAAGTSQSFVLDAEFSALLEYANTAFTISEGLFDITSGVLGKVWDFKSGQSPKTEEITKTLALVGWDKVTVNADNFFLPTQGMALDFGGIVKEYAADVIAALVRSHHIKYGLIDLGGDIAVVGPHLDNTPWQVAISDPQTPSKPIAMISLMSGGLASSGDYQRFITLDGQRYSHILNPKTGWPVKGLAAVSVWAPQCVMAGTIATTAMLKGEPEGLGWLDETGCQYLAVNQALNIFRSTSSSH